jgi:hypothetical protein
MVELPVLDGAMHPYVGASSACWTRFAEVNVTLPRVSLARLVTDAYMVQHPGVPERRAIQSVCVHLVGLCLVLQHGLPEASLTSVLQDIIRRPPAWRWLEPPTPNGDLTIVDVGTAGEGPEAAAIVAAYVRGIWAAWAPHHDTVEAWAAEWS